MDADPPPLRPAEEPAGEGDTGPAARRRVRVAKFKFFVPKPVEGDADVMPPGTATAPAIDAALALAVLALAVFLGSFAATNSDLWLHLASGRLVAAGKFPFGSDPFSAVGASWINTAWLFDLIAYVLYQPGGALLVAAKAGLIVATAAVLLAIRRPGGGGFGPAAVTTLVLLAASPAFILRSSVASYLLFAVLLWLLNRNRVRSEEPGSEEKEATDSSPLTPHSSPPSCWRFLLAVGVLFLFWVNLDGGFVFGLLLLAAWTVGSVLQRVLPLGDRDEAETGHAPGMLLLALGVAVIACLANPYHVRAFRLPTELAAIGLPNAVQANAQIRSWFGVSPLETGGPDTPAYTTYAGVVPAAALYLLMAVAVLSFAVNAGGWRWSRVLAWAAFAWLGSRYGRLVPYLALTCGPIAVLNFQAALARRRAAQTEKVNRRVAHLQVTLANLARSALLLGILILLALAWPGWLGREPRSDSPPRRVVWRAVPDPTYERLAKWLASRYAAGELREGQDHGFHVQPDFSAYCAWFCPAEKGLIDPRLTAPPEVVSDYLTLQRQVRGLGLAPGPDHPGPPDPLLQKFGITHLVVAGPEALHEPPEVRGLAVTLFTAPNRWPLWAIEGRGVICGWRDLRLTINPARLATSSAEPRSSVGDYVRDAAAPPEAPSLWDRYRAAAAPVPVDAYEAGLWLAYREAVQVRAVLVAIPFWQAMNFLARSAPAGPPIIGTEFVDVSNVIEAAWWRSPEGRGGVAAALLAVRAARRAIAANPDDPEAYVRLTQAYSHLDTDQALGLMQRIGVARQGLARLAVAPRRANGPLEELFLQEQLYFIYRNAIVVPGTQSRPFDLIQEALARVVELRRNLPNKPPGPQFERQQQQMEQELARLTDTVSKRRDEVENATRGKPPRSRAEFACGAGLAREALNTLRDAAPAELDTPAAVLFAHLMLIAGESENAWVLLSQMAQGPSDRFPVVLRHHVDTLAVQAAAAVGDYPAAIERCDALLEMTRRQTAQESAHLLGNLIFAEAAPSPLATGLMLPAWGGLWKQDQVTVINNFPLLGDLPAFAQFRGQATDWLARQGMLALEAGNATLARRRFGEAAVGGGADRDLARRWLESWNSSTR
jgi:hypothetical protein